MDTKALDELLEMDASIEPNLIEEPEYHELVRHARSELDALKATIKQLYDDVHNRDGQIGLDNMNLKDLRARLAAAEADVESAKKIMYDLYNDTPSGHKWEALLTFLSSHPETKEKK